MSNWITQSDLAVLTGQSRQVISYQCRRGSLRSATQGTGRDSLIDLDHPDTKAWRRSLDGGARFLTDATHLTLEQFAKRNGIPLERVVRDAAPGGPLHPAIVEVVDFDLATELMKG